MKQKYIKLEYTIETGNSFVHRINSLNHFLKRRVVI